MPLFTPEIDALFLKYPIVKTIIHDIALKKGKALLVGGAVRDFILKRSVKDFDIEVYHFTVDQLESLLKKYGPVSLVGKSFGVLRLHGLDIDWSLPRRDSFGRKPLVSVDPHMSFEDAFRRRDLTMNALGIDVETGELIDPFGGYKDIQKKIVRTPDPTFFSQDPLRFFRVMQIIGRFEMDPDAELTALCKAIDLTGVSKERIAAEYEKLLLKSTHPSRGFRWLASIDRIHELLPELAGTIGVAQNPLWHPEGDVFEHTMQVIDAAAAIVSKYTDEQEKLIVLFAALCHDLGKQTTSVVINGTIKSPEHARAGVPLAKTLLGRMTQKKELISAVKQLVLYHMVPLQFIKSGARPSRYKRLAGIFKVPVTFALLIDLARADHRGRNKEGKVPLITSDEGIELFAQRVAEYNLMREPEMAVLQGKDIIDCVSPGPEMGKILKRAYEIQLTKNIHDKELLKKIVLKDQYLKKD